MAEYARHFRVDRTPGLAAQTYQRKVYRFEIELEHLIDLRNSKVWAELCLTKAPDCFKDKAIARATAHFIRNTTATQAILVPSIAFLDDLDQYCLVIFLEKLPPDAHEFLLRVQEDGYFQISKRSGQWASDRILV